MAGSPRVDDLKKKFDENPRRYFAPLANEYRKAGDFAQAIAICREYLPQQPGHMSGHIVFGQALYEARQFDEAKSVFETALTLDPENLIALKHLGDIALIGNNTEVARGWYKKILDADPRNEEILAQLSKLEQKVSGAKIGATMVMAAVPRPGTAPKAPKPAAPAAPAASSAVTKPVPTVPAAAPKPEAPAAPVPPAPAPATATSPTAEIRLDTVPTHAPPVDPPPMDMAIGFEPTSAGVSAAEVPAAPTLEIDVPVSAQREAPPAESGGLEGLETTSLGASPPPAPALEQSPAVAMEPVSAPAAETIDLDISVPTPASEPPKVEAAEAPVADINLDFAPPPAPEPPTPAPATAPAPEINLDFGTSPAAPAASEDLPLLDLGDMPSTPAASAPAPAAAPTPAPEPEPVAMVPEVAPPPAPAPIEAVSELAAPTAPQSGPFVTETMADLYLKQGHAEEALRVYRALQQQRPSDSIAAKIAALEAQLRGPAPMAAPTPQRAVLPAASGPSIRDLLAFVATRRPGSRGAVAGNGGPAYAPHADTSHLVTPAADALSSIIGSGEVDPYDEAAGIMLASAFASTNGHRQAPLDAVVATPGAPAPSNFSFDQFFSARATAEHGTQVVPETPAGESKDDVAQFSQWLEGLKRK